MNDIAHSAALSDVLYSVIECDAETHGSAFNKENYNNVLKAIIGNKIQAYLVIVEKDGLPRYGGGAIQFPSVLTSWNGVSFDHFPALYREDIFVMPEISSEFKQWTKSADFPRGVGLGAYLTHEEVRAAVFGSPDDRPFGMIAYGLLGEYAPDNFPIVNSLGKMGSNLGQKNQSAVLYFPNDFKSPEGQSSNVELCYLASHEFAAPCENVFSVLWKSEDEHQQIVATFTEALSTFTGEPVIRVQITSNEFLPDNEELKNIIGGIIQAGEKEVSKRGWATEHQNPINLMRFHLLQEPETISALTAMGAKPRFLGQHLMLPITLGFQDIPDTMISFDVPKAKPMAIVSSQQDILRAEQKGKLSTTYMVA